VNVKPLPVKGATETSGGVADTPIVITLEIWETKVDRNTALDYLEIMNAQVGNGGFYQYYINVVEKQSEHLESVQVLAQLGSSAKMQYYPELVKILNEYAYHIQEYENLPYTEREEIKEDREDTFASKLDTLDDRYYNINDMIPNNFNDIAMLSNSMYK
jgi:hypothetical protein